jgi:iron-sulfur cluster repair protein YtfE (RIC family)
MISDTLNADHHRLEAVLSEAVIAARSANWHVYQKRFEALNAALLEHIAYEDNELFPRVARLLGPEVLGALRGEHRRLQASLQKLVETERAVDPEGWLALLEGMAALLREHHASELRICYPVVARAESSGLVTSRTGAGG